ncbi:MAG: hypothetical protein BJ554DRAFT_4193 [Olpidium bornovanus]|uniref:Uncharacterized protein n=1 Tax=Olpidium bornovanus TaxID=278681 RepID=A0A8H7ZMI9_9FUNG|nr:MAG: hypothetical protein BJ554DRAFT_4193 [Olpidium bornovanus]
MENAALGRVAAAYSSLRVAWRFHLSQPAAVGRPLPPCRRLPTSIRNTATETAPGLRLSRKFENPPLSDEDKLVVPFLNMFLWIAIGQQLTEGLELQFRLSKERDAEEAAIHELEWHLAALREQFEQTKRKDDGLRGVTAAAAAAAAATAVDA